MRSCLSAGLGGLRCDDPPLPRHPLPPLVVQQEQVRGHRPQEGLEVAFCAHAQPYGLEIYFPLPLCNFVDKKSRCPCAYAALRAEGFFFRSCATLCIRSNVSCTSAAFPLEIAQYATLWTRSCTFERWQKNLKDILSPVVGNRVC
jgi:hypothetical protein